MISSISGKTVAIDEYSSDGVHNYNFRVDGTIYGGKKDLLDLIDFMLRFMNTYEDKKYKLVSYDYNGEDVDDGK